MNLSRAYFPHAVFYDNPLRLNCIGDPHHIGWTAMYESSNRVAISETRVRQLFAHAIRTLSCIRGAIIAERT